jgi:hypothetical protein
MNGFLQSVRHFRFSWLMVTLALFGLYMMIANDIGLRERTIGEALDGLFYLGLGWLIRSNIAKVDP